MNNALGCYEYLEDAFQALLDKSQAEDVEQSDKVVYTITLAGNEPHMLSFADHLRTKGHRVTTGGTVNTINGRWVVSNDWANEVMKDLWFDFETQ